MTIQEYIRKNHPDHWNSGKWGCQLIGSGGITKDQMEEEHPHGFQISVSPPTRKYWIWFDHD